MRTSEKRKRCAGLTMIELVSALTIMVMLVGVLYIMLNRAMDIWAVSGNGQREQEQADRTLKALVEDLEQAVVMPLTTTNHLSKKEEAASFILDTDQLYKPQRDRHYSILRIAVPADPRIQCVEIDEQERLSLDMVVYSFYNNAIYRHQVPLERPSENRNVKPEDEDYKQLCQVLYEAEKDLPLEEICRKMDENQGILNEIYEGTHARLVKNVSAISLLGAIPYTEQLDTSGLGSQRNDKVLDTYNQNGGETFLPEQEFNLIYANTLPWRVNAHLTVQQESDWLRYNELCDLAEKGGVEGEEAEKEAAAMGIHSSIQISLGTAAASRLE